MGYETPIGGVSRALSEHVFIHSAPFKRMGLINFGARMSVIRLSPDNYVIFSAVPYEDTVIKSLSSEIKDENWLSKVTHVIIPDIEHTMGVKSYMGKLKADTQIVGMNTRNEEVNSLITVKVDGKSANKLLGEPELKTLGITDSLFLENVKLIFFPGHQNKELVLYEKQSNTAFTGDLFFNIAPADASGKHTNEQFHSRPGFPSSTLNPTSRAGRFFMKKLLADTPATRNAMKELCDIKFNTLVMCHGDVIESNAFESFKTTFKHLI